jgi:hypothetical protein
LNKVHRHSDSELPSSLTNADNVTIANPGIAGRTMLEHISNMYRTRMWILFIWLLVESSAEVLLAQVNTRPVISGEILVYLSSS